MRAASPWNFSSDSPIDLLQPGLKQAEALGLVTTTPDSVRPTALGLAFLNDLLALFA